MTPISPRQLRHRRAHRCSAYTAVAQSKAGSHRRRTLAPRPNQRTVARHCVTLVGVLPKNGPQTNGIHTPPHKGTKRGETSGRLPLVTLDRHTRKLALDRDENSLRRATVRQCCRRLEGDLDSKLAQLSRQEDSSSGAAVGLSREIETLLQDLEQVNDQMSREAMDSPGGTATAMHKLQRHREILHDFQQEFARSRAQLRQATERSQLLSSVRETISEHRYAASQASDALLRERNAIAASGRAADEVLGQAAATRDALNAQRGGFGSMSGKLGALSALAPQIDSLISAISRRHKRDKIILAVTFGVCTGLLLLYGFGLGG